jgi:hypothetical protein
LERTLEIWARGHRPQTSINEEDDNCDLEKEDEKEICLTCLKCNDGQPNPKTEERIRICKAAMKNGKVPQGQYQRDDFTSSTLLDDYLFPTILTWQPERGRNLSCWHEGSRGVIRVKEYGHRFVEGLSATGYICYPIYFCIGCKKTKSSLCLEDLHEMGVPGYAIRR